MRKSFIALALLVGAIAMLTTSAMAQLERDELGLKLSNAKIAQMQVSKASRLGTSTLPYDTLFIGHSSHARTSTNPFRIGDNSQYRPTLNHEGIWDFDVVYGGAEDSLQGWTPFVGAPTSMAGTQADYLRPWWCLDFGNRLNQRPTQGRTTGVISAWHVDAGVNQPPVGQPVEATPWWEPLSGSASAWCGLRCSKDVAYLDDPLYGGTGNPYNGDVLWGTQAVSANGIRKVLPGFVSRWDQMLYRDVRVASGASLTVSFKYRNQTGPEIVTTNSGCTGWFNFDPMSVSETPLYDGGPTNFISAPRTAKTAPIDSFMVYVGVPTDPLGFMNSAGDTVPIFDMKRRWFSEVLKIDVPYIEILSTWGWDSVYASTPKEITLTGTQLAPLLAAQGAGDGGGVLRIVFRSKTNRNSSDEDAIAAGGPGFSYTHGAVRIDDVSITGCATPVSSGFETAGEINNNIEPLNTATPGPHVGQGYALGYWHATGKPPRALAHTHPIYQTDISNVIGVPNVYDGLYWTDICGKPDSPARICNLEGVVVSTGDHDADERSSGGAGTVFRSNLHGLLSPTINMVVPPTGDNEMGVDKAHKETPNGWFFRHDAMLGVFSIPGENCAWQIDVLCYPVLDGNGFEMWSDAFNTGFISYNPDKQCYWMDDDISSLVYTSHESGLPDSIKIAFYKYSYCSNWGGAPLCNSPDGHYIDNLAFYMMPAGGGASDKIQVDLWDWYQDAFPANESVGYPGNYALFDTCGAHIMTGLNESQATGDGLRFNIPGDSVTCLIANATNTPIRMDCVFRIYPGPGNYVTAGSRESGLRAVPSDPAPASSGTTGASAFWKSYLANPGPYGKGVHPLVGGVRMWNPDTWNSVRIDTAEFNMFPMDGIIDNVPGLDETVWQTTIHEDDPNYATLGISKVRCFPTELKRDLTSDNTTCGTAPDWVLADPSGVGYNGDPTTIELTKIFPDGLLTPGSHVEYFLRMSHIGSEGDFVMCPDTNLICPQPWEGPNWDAHRWQQFSILPDRWKSGLYGPSSDACMLVVDANDRRGNERVFVGLADSIGLTKSEKYGAHNGWHCEASYVAPDGSHDYWGQDVGLNDAICIRDHKGQPGSLWDMYQIKGSESGTTSSARIGGRLANRDAMGLAEGKFGRQGPTPDMLRAYYKMVFFMSGDLNTPIFGDADLEDYSAHDVELMEDYLGFGTIVGEPRGFWAMGNGFIESQETYNYNYTFIWNYCGTYLRNKSYYSLSGANLNVKLTDLTPAAVITTGGEVYATQNLCTFTNDVQDLTGRPGVVEASYYEPMGDNAPYTSGVYGPSVVGHPYITLTDGWEIDRMLSPGSSTDGSQSDVGRLLYFGNVLQNAFGSICPFVPTLTVDVPTNTIRNVDFLGNVWGNPMVAGGKATVHFGLAKTDRVEIKVYDVTGRLVKTLANRDFPGGEHTLVWDGTNDQGRTVARGVYFTQVKYVNSHFVDAKKVTVLK